MRGMRMRARTAIYAGEASARYALKRERDRFSESYFCLSTQSLHWHEMACGFSIVWFLRFGCWKGFIVIRYRIRMASHELMKS